MKVKLRGIKQIHINGDYIKLDALLKYAAVVSTGGEAKIIIQNGEVYLDGKMCTIRGKKVKPGNVVRYGSTTLVVKHKDYDS